MLEGRQLDYYRGARWGGSTIEVVQTLLVDSLEDQRLFRSVTAEQARVAGDYVLDVEVRDFQAEYANGGAPTAHVTMIGRLIRVVDRELVATVSGRGAQQGVGQIACTLSPRRSKTRRTKSRWTLRRRPPQPSRPMHRN